MTTQEMNETLREGTGTRRSFTISGMSCPSCGDRIEEALRETEGVGSAVVDFSAGLATVEWESDSGDSNRLKEMVSALGYGLHEPGKEDPGSESGNQKTNLWPFAVGAVASLAVVGFYLGLLTLTSDFHNAWADFKFYAGWIISLALGLGVQATLFSILRTKAKGRSMRGAKCSLAASGGISTSAMAACCAHYLVTILPLLGLPFLSAAAAGLANYQTYFFLAGVLSSLLGIGLMLRTMKKAGLYFNGRNGTGST